RPFAVNILAAGQEDLAWHFAGRAQPDLEVAWVEGRLCPRLAHSLAYFECSPWRAYDGGDHVLFLGRVEAFAYGQGEPLVFYASRLTRLVPPGPQPERSCPDTAAGRRGRCGPLPPPVTGRLRADQHRDGAVV